MPGLELSSHLGHLFNMDLLRKIFAKNRKADSQDI